MIQKLCTIASGPVPKKIFDPKPFLVGHLGPNLSLHTPFTPLPDTFLVILVKRMTLKKNLPPPLKIGLKDTFKNPGS